ncbi:N6-adenosine-specific RNA methylase IME4 [Rhizobium sp. SLBN-94]|nr:N6-adenosine-specific RNA methylase IME4 [Rhizobium sp. SLBN-94]
MNMVREIHPLVERHPTALVLSEETTFEQWTEIGQWLQSVERSVMWWIGDWVRFGEHRWGEKYTQAIEATGHSYQTLRDAAWVSGSFDLSERSDKLPWSHYRQAASLHKDNRNTVLREAEAEGWSVRETRAQVNRIKNEARLPAATAPVEGRKVFDFDALVRNGEKFGTIYADPPWLYDNQGTRAATGNHYGGLTVEELCALPVKDIVAKDAHLHLWTTNGFLFECPKIFEAWGFEFRSSFVWVKPQMGIGNYWRNSHEFLLTAIRGDAKRFNDRSLMSWLQCERGVHSAKPEQVRHFIERASPGPFLEMFARSGAPNWTVWGNQIPGNLLDHGMAEVA